MPLTSPVPSPDPIERLGTALAAFSSDVSRREEELNRLVKQIAVERNQLLDIVLNRMFDGFSGFIPFDRVLCSFLANSATTSVAYWMRSLEAAKPVPDGHTTTIAGSGLYELTDPNQPLIVDDLTSLASARASDDLLRRLVEDGAVSSLTCPLTSDGVPLGFLLFTSRERGAYQTRHVAAFQRLANQVSLVVQKTAYVRAGTDPRPPASCREAAAPAGCDHRPAHRRAEPPRPR